MHDLNGFQSWQPSWGREGERLDEKYEAFSHKLLWAAKTSSLKDNHYNSCK